MTKLDQIRALFAAKMAAQADYEAAAGKAWTLMEYPTRTWVSRLLPRLRDYFGLPNHVQYHHDVCTGHKVWLDNEVVSSATWWWHREQVRLTLGIYPAPTDTLSTVIQLLQLQPYAVHMSTDPETPEAVCYTPSMEYGVADRQIKLSSLSKLITKLFPLASEEFKQTMDAAHKAELDPTISFARTVEEIERVYRNMDGDSGCMRYGPEHWDLPLGFHPSHVYAAPGVAVAYHEVNGFIKARALTWEDAVTGKKQYVRLYGDRVLERKLQRAGYEFGSMAGAKIKAVQVPESRYGAGRYVVPYIDGGLGNSTSDGYYGYIDKRDPAHIQLVSEERRAALVRAGISVGVFRDHRQVVHHLEPQDLSAIEFTCPLTGMAVDRSQDAVRYVFLNGKRTPVLSTTDVAQRFPELIYRLDNGSLERTWHYAGTPTFYEPRKGQVFDDAEHRAHLGYKLLSPTFYGPNHWAKDSLASDVNGEVIRVADAVCLVRADDSFQFAHKSTVTQVSLRQQGYYRVSAVDSSFAAHYTHKDNPNLVVLNTGKRAHKRLSGVCELFDGTWTSQRNTSGRTFYAEPTIWYKNQPLPVTADMAGRALKSVLVDMFDFNQFCELALLRNGMDVTNTVAYIRHRMESSGRLNALRRAAGSMPVFNHRGEFAYMTSAGLVMDITGMRQVLTQMRGLPQVTLDEQTEADRNHIALAIAVYTEYLSLYDNLPTLVAAALTRMGEDCPARPAPAPADNAPTYMEAA